ncbi:MAG: hypothetical protein SF339_02560 [Blastocatellia bacterium]|nr:hypothetical protein [Blastocatellia bacterium]
MTQERKFQVGINYPWIDYAWDFGDPPAAWVGPDYVAEWRARKRAQIRTDFQAFAEQGLFAVRWFLLADGLSYGTGADAPRIEAGKWTFQPLPREHRFHKQFCDDFAFVLKTCAEFKLQFVPSLIDFHWCHQGVAADASGQIVKGGRADLVRDKAKRDAFFDAVLEPLLDISMQSPETLYAWELINEPEWVTEVPSLMQIRSDPNKTVTLDEMRAFIAEGIGRINHRRLPDGRAAFRSSVGFAHWDAVADWDSPGLGVTLHQFHYYAPDKRKIPNHVFSPEYPCFLGEFATTFHRGWPDLRKADLARTITARLKCVEEKGYPSAFLWSARATDEATTWTGDDRNETLAFIRGDSSSLPG